jgi:hypothetical protein
VPVSASSLEVVVTSFERATIATAATSAMMPAAAAMPMRALRPVDVGVGVEVA